MSQMIDLCSGPNAPSTPLLPLFITCDPARDTPTVMKTYLAEFHPAMIGLTGTWERIKAVCKAYRVYFSTPEGVKPGMDYLVDHSIYFYLMGEFAFFGSCLGVSNKGFFPGYCTDASDVCNRPGRRFRGSDRPSAQRRARSGNHYFPHERLERGCEKVFNRVFPFSQFSVMTRHFDHFIQDSCVDRIR